MIPGHPLLPRARLEHVGIVLLAAILLGLPGTASADLVLTELMAVADENRRDEDGAPSDWLELTNTGSQPQSLLGHYLSNNRNNLMQWEFPDVDIGAGSYLVIYASGKDRTGQELHTSFTLDRDGEYLALVAPDGVTVVSEIAPQYPEQFEQVSYGVAPPGNPLDLALGYFEQPTPGSGNGTVSGPPPAEIVFSETSRMFTQPFNLELHCPTPGAVIRYTTDRTVP
ncbi:MAG: lamin tail domain-containing protein [Roseibacillus sp.]|nr:lamin tail domain-containing protein [Roseibacillus sp.]